jgi:DNA invertase Pin-like site-specific DNA recombinase
MARQTVNKPLAFSYLRFSDAAQAEGDSIRRQTALRDAWIEKAGAVLDTSLKLQDSGVSAFKGKHKQNPDRHALAAFLDLVKRGRVPRGSYLVVENLDRLSREDIRPALTLLLNLIEAGVRVVQLLPAETVFDERVEPMTLMMAIMELSRGHSESRMKSERLGGAWKEKKRLAAEDKIGLTAKTPAWVKVEGHVARCARPKCRGCRLVLDKRRAEVVRRIYRLAAEGYGLAALCKRLNAENVPPIGRAGYWARSYLGKLLTTRATMGEYQPHSRWQGKRTADGAAIADYFPAVVSEDEWHAARAAMVSRRQKGGRPAPRVNLFAGLLRDARDGGSLHQVNKGAKGGGAVLVSYRAAQGLKGAVYCSFPFDTFERAILSKLREIDVREILPGDDRAADAVQALTGRLADTEGRIEQVKAKLLDDGDVSSLADVLRSLDAKRKAIAEDLAEAKRAAASPLDAAWSESGSLLAALDNAPDQEEIRVRLRAAMRRTVENIWCLFVAKGSIRLAAVQVHFAGGARRHYLILHKTRPQDWAVLSFADAGLDGKVDLDLSKRKDAAAMAKTLAAIDIAGLSAD